MLGNHGRSVTRTIFTPLARLLIKLHVGPNAVTAGGTVLVTGFALWLLPTGHLWQAALILGALAFLDSVDGNVARLSGKTSNFGAFLDSTLDRVSDAAVFGGLVMYFALRHDHAWSLWGLGLATACLALGAIVPYARARAESLGAKASVGLAERTDRLVLTLVVCFWVGVGLTAWVLVAALGLLAIASLFTVWQRIQAVYHQIANQPRGD